MVSEHNVIANNLALTEGATYKPRGYTAQLS